VFRKPISCYRGAKRTKMTAIFTFVLIFTLLTSAEEAASAQQSKKIPQIGWISLWGRNPPDTGIFPRRNSPNRIAFMEGLRERGYTDGQHIIINYRSAEGREDRLPEIAAELLRLKVDVMVADTNAATRAAKKATTTIPVVFIYGDPVWDGLVASLAKPGGNLTGLSILAPQLAGKRLELLRDVLPTIYRIAVLLDPDASVHRREFAEIQPLAQALRVQLQALELRDSQPDFERLFRQASGQRADAVLILPNPTVTAHRQRLLDIVARSRLPAMYPDSRFTEEGGLMSYGPSHPDLYRRAAFYVDKILKGAKPADLPVEQPTKFELIVNLTTAKTLGLTIPPKVLTWADKVISNGGQMPEKTLATKSSTDAQRSAKIHRIGILAPGKFGRFMPADALRQELRNLGYVEGQNIAYEYRWADGNEDRLPALAAELLRMKVEIIVATSALAARAAQRLTQMTPIIASATSDPIGMGLVKSLGQPGGNITGLSHIGPELGGKRLELLKEITPGISRVAVLARLGKADPARETSIKEVEAVARSLNVQLHILNVNTSEGIENAFAAIAREKAGALTVLTQSMLLRNGQRIVELAAKNRLPAMYPRSEYVEAGGLVSYGPDRLADQRRAAHFVDKILKGAKPADLPVEQPTKFELAINLNTAKALELTIPPKVLMWADRIIK
jgi:putative tryptophan/tyrosine transport system substrate-binding protein